MRRKAIIIWLIAATLVAVVAWQARQAHLALQNPAIISGYSALAVMIALVLFNVRKKLSMIPLVSARVWLIIHVAFGVALLPMVWLHTGSLWPEGLYEQVLIGLFYLVSGSGIFGYWLSLTVPRRLRHLGGEIIYERIPHELHEVREQVKQLIFEAVEASGHETLTLEYKQSLAWFFARPRFFFSHLSGSRRPSAWQEQKAQSLKPFLGEAEMRSFEKIERLMDYKNKVDGHYAAQSFLKYWLYFHLPVSLSLIIFVLWHVLLVHLYAL
ncbi:MAG: hypothetical protein HKN50_07235 [Gammaproteobacteria bacterium]|nr:hypothetical protein [Gammaproteobacteria bacterium]